MEIECESGNCGSQSFHVGDDGYTYCSEGHRQIHRGQAIAEDTETLPQYGRKQRKRSEGEDERADTGLTGKRAFEHYLLCFQLVLWKQVHWLITEKQLPQELETVVRDIWSLRLQTLQAKANYELDAERSSQLFSSQSEGETTDEESQRRKGRNQAKDSTPQVIDAISMCYIGVLLLRLPVTIGDLYQWTASGQLTYYRAIKILPQTMRERLPGTFHIRLDPQTVLEPKNLHLNVLENIIIYDQEFGMAVPSPNHLLVLYRWMRLLALPLEVYAATLRLADMLRVDFAYIPSLNPIAGRLVLRLAETKLISLLVVATKLLFPFDARERYPRKPTELAALAMDWDKWSQARSNFHTITSPGGLDYEGALKISTDEVMEMTNDKLDDYMDWYETAFIDENIRETGREGRNAEFRRAMFRFFPTTRTTPKPITTDPNPDERQLAECERVKRVQASLEPLRVLPEDLKTRDGGSVMRPGSSYRRHRSVQELRGHEREFHEEAAKLVGIPLDWLVQGVFLMERKLQRWEENARR